MKAVDKNGEIIVGLPVFLNSFLKDAEFGLENFIQGLKVFKNTLSLEASVDLEIDKILEEYSFHENQFKTFEQCFKEL